MALLAIVTFSGSHSVSLVSFPATDLGMLKVMVSSHSTLCVCWEEPAAEL